MKQIGSRITVAIIVLLSLLKLAQADELYKKDFFSISLPDGWVEIPKDIIDAKEKEVAQKAPNFPVQHADYGFQLGSAKRWFEYPYILIQIRNTGRIPENQLEKTEKYSFQESLDKNKKNLRGLITDLQAGKAYYDKDTNMIWLRFEVNGIGVGPVSGLSAMVPTEKGFIQVNAYALKNEFLTYEKKFITSAMSVTPSRELIYKHHVTDNLPPAVEGIDWDKVVAKAVAGVILGAVATLFIGFRNKRRK